MPFIKLSSPKDHVYIGLWKISESLSELYELYHPLIPENEIEKFKIEERKKQWLAVRVLLKKLANDNNLNYSGITKDNYQKPFPKNENYNISISHAGEYAVAIINTKEATGIDIETLSPKISRIKNKFLNEKEISQTQNNLEELCIYWSSKETLYKYYGKKKVIFKDELLINKKPHEFQFQGEIIKDDLCVKIPIQLIKREEYIIVFSY